jgi:DNA modification methylase
MLELNKIHHLDNRQGLAALSPKCANLIISDPPYFEVKGEFDFVWKSFDEYLEFIDHQAILYKRILADNGTLFIWGHAKRIAYIQVIFDKYFNLENSLIWRKIDSMQYQYYSPELARTFNTHNERLLMYSNEVKQTGLERLMDEFIKPNHPIAAYLHIEFKRAGVTNKEIAALFPSRTGGLTGCVSNWLNGDNVITEDQYKTIKQYLGSEYLRREYEDLRREYEDLRRPFNNFRKLEDVLSYSQEGNKTKLYDHPTQKPEKLTSDLITTCTRPDDLIVVPFAGSGTECAMATKTGRQFIGFEIDSQYVEIANQRAGADPGRPQLFEPVKIAEKQEVLFS